MLVLAMMAFSATAIPTHALITANTLSIAGSSTVYPIAQTAAQSFPTYWNSIAAGLGSSPINTINLAGLGSGTAFKTVLPTTGSPTADLGEMSRPPSTGEWTQSNAGNAHIWAVGVDSLAIVYSADMTWAPTQMSQKQAASLFLSTDAAGNNPMYTTWGQFLTDYYGNLSQAIPAAAVPHEGDLIHRIVRDPTSGTYDCFNNFFGKQYTSITGSNGAEIVDGTGAITGSQYMAPYTLGTANQDIVNNLNGAHDSVAFIGLGYYQKNQALMIGISMQNGANFYAPTQANVIAGNYLPFRWLWELTPSTIPSTGPNLAEGVWIAYMKLDANVQGGNPNFVTSNDYMDMPRAAMAGGHVKDSNLADYTPAAGQTQTVPRLVVDSNDFFYFMDAYIAYYGSHIYNPYADINAQGKIDGNSFLGFMSAYVYYYTTYAPTH